jgi:Bacterial Ig-like domain (group 2)/Secretion system C-terminal sorting domain/Carbohydrate binding module (family 6)
MNFQIGYQSKQRHYKVKSLFTVRILFVYFLLGIIDVNAQVEFSPTTDSYKLGNEQLVVYRSIPGVTPSEYYTIRVKSKATNNQWKSCFTNLTKSLYTAANPANYFSQLNEWSHTYSNIEMSPGSVVEVEIGIVPLPSGKLLQTGAFLEGKSITSASIRPAHRASAPLVTNGKVYFTIDSPGQITIDINGQMDGQQTGAGYTGPAVHTVSLFANPICDDRPAYDAGTTGSIYYVQPNTPVEQIVAGIGSNTIVYFRPGVHNIQRNFKIVRDKKYYIPGDAIVYGTFANSDQTANSGANIKLYGYGTISGDLINHYDLDKPAGMSVDDYKKNYPSDSYRLIYSDKCADFKIVGLSLMNCPMHTVKVTSPNSLSGIQSSARWVKVVSWRVNGDGLGGLNLIEDSFIRTQDDCSYVKGNQKRNIFWTDANGSVFSMSNMQEAKIKPVIIEDIDVIYARNRSLTTNGGRVFAKRSDQGHGGGTDKTKNPAIVPSPDVEVEFKNIRISDPFETLETFQILSTGNGTIPNADGTPQTSGGYANILFQNITSVKTPNPQLDNQIVGWSGGIWDNIRFNNVMLGSLKIETAADFRAMGPYVNVSAITAGIPATGVTINNPPTDLLLGATRKLSATVSPSNASDQMVSWISSKPFVATVTNNGVVIAKALGSVTITAKTSNGITTNFTFTVKERIQTPYLSTVRTIPTDVIEGEHYDEGGHNVAYFDDQTKSGLQTYRPGHNVDVVSKTNGSNGLAVGFPLVGEWLDYTVNAIAGTYNLTLKYFCNSATIGKLLVTLDGVVLGTFQNIANQGSQTAQGSITIPNITIAEGTGNRLRLQYKDAAKFDIDCIQFSPSASPNRVTATLNTTDNELKAGIEIYPNPVQQLLHINFPDAATTREILLVNMLGQVVFSTKTSNNQLEIDVKSLHLKGLVLVKVISDKGISTQKVIVE